MGSALDLAWKRWDGITQQQISLLAQEYPRGDLILSCQIITSQASQDRWLAAVGYLRKAGLILTAALVAFIAYRNYFFWYDSKICLNLAVQPTGSLPWLLQASGGALECLGAFLDCCMGCGVRGVWGE